MYDELAKALRETDFSDGCPCEADPPCSSADCIIVQAADAIEELSKDLERSKEWEGFWKEQAEEAKGKLQQYALAVADKPRWIPVTERLPKEYVNVLCYYEYYRYGEYNCMFRTIDRGYYGDGIWGGEAGQGHKNKVLAWMPLPEPPKED